MNCIPYFTCRMLLAVSSAWFLLLPACHEGDLKTLSSSIPDSTFQEIHLAVISQEEFESNAFFRNSDTLPRNAEQQLKLGLSNQNRRILFKYPLNNTGWEAWMCLDSPGDASEDWGYLLIPFEPEHEVLGKVMYLAKSYEEYTTNITESWISKIDAKFIIVTKHLSFAVPDPTRETCVEGKTPAIEMSIFEFGVDKFVPFRGNVKFASRMKMGCLAEMKHRFGQAGFDYMIPLQVR